MLCAEIMVLEIFLSILTDLAVDPIREYVVAPIKRHVGYAFTYKSKLEKLKDQVEKLTVERQNMQLSASEASRRGDKLLPGVQEWLNKAEGAIGRANFVISTEDEATKCFNLKKRYQLSSNAEKAAAAVTELQNRSKFDRICRRPTLKQRGASSVDEDEELYSRSFIFNEVMSALADAEVNMVGVYGLGGIGKTTLADKVRRQATEDKSFDLVFMATVSSTPDLDRIRQQIAEMLRLKFEEETSEGKADRLHQTLMTKNKILLILDDIWEEISLQTVGIPYSKEHKGCKILFTSRSLNVLLAMNSRTNFNLESLSDVEAWHLFEKMVGQIKDEVRDIAIQVAKKCGGFPLLISTVAKALNNKDLNDWKYALRQLSRADNKGIQAVVHKALELSYNHLISDEVKVFFLLCGHLGQPEISIDNLFMYSVGLNLLEDSDTMEDGRIILLKWISDLKASCFLLDSNKRSFVRIHDLVRDFAVTIASKDMKVFSMKSYGVVLKEWPREDELKDCTRICIPNCQFHELPKRLECQNANLCILGCEMNSYLEISESFFEGTKKLKVLHLLNFKFSKLPISFGSLTDLCTLCLHNCQLHDAAVVGKLNNLEMLSFRNSNIEELPGEIGQLSRLKVLDLSRCNQLNSIPTDVLSRLYFLEELYIDYRYKWWGLMTFNNLRNASIVELEGLSRLKTLQIFVPSAKMIPKGLFFNNLVMYEIQIGEIISWWSIEENFSKTLMLKLCEKIHLEVGVNMLLKKAECLLLDFVEEEGIIKNLLFDLDSGGFPELKYLYLENAARVQFLINMNSRVPCQAAFPILESLSIYNLTSLDKICQGPFVTGSFSKLTILRVEGCHSLRNLLSPSMVTASTLQELCIYDCSNIEEIVAKESGNEDKEVVVFSHLRILKLKNLPQLRCFCIGASQTITKPFTKDGGFDKNVPEIEIDTSLSLFNEMVAFPVVEDIRINDIGNINKLWQCSLPTNSFDKLKSLVVERCGNLETVFPFNVMGTFQRLETLRICGCDSLQEIYQLQDEYPADVEFELKGLYLENLPKLKHIWIKDPHEKFEERQSDTEEMVAKLGKEVEADFFSPAVPKLTFLTLQLLPRLRFVFSESMALRLEQLQSMRIGKCEMMEEIIRSETAERTTIRQITFSMLKRISLSRLPKLSCFYSRSGSLYFPSLEKISIDDLLFVSQHSHSREQNPRIDDEETNNKQLDKFIAVAPFFSHKVAPEVKELELRNKAMEMIFGCQLTEEFLSKIKVVDAWSIIHKSTVSLPDFLKRLHNLEKLRLNFSSIKELFGHEGCEEEVIRKLQLQQQDFRQQQLVLHLETLEVSCCDNLISLAPSSASFQNLKTLTVDYCNGMTKLVTASAAKSMVQLVNMRVQSCDKLTEIVANEESWNTEEITFHKLKTLYLDDLNNLESFCSSSCYTLKFPSLERFTLNRCLKMRIFCHQELGAPKLKRIERSGGKWYWEGNLNATIQHMYMEMVGFGDCGSLKLSEYTQLTEKWNSELPLNFFGNLNELVVDNCSSISKAVPSNVLHFLSNVDELTVEKCDSVEQIFDLKGLNVDEVVNVRLLNNLSRLYFVELPKLKHVFHLSTALSLVSLQSLEVRGCISLDQIITVEDEEEPAAWDRTTIFLKLKTIKLQNLPALTSFYSRSGVIKCPLLTKIYGSNCPKMKILDFVEESHEQVVDGGSHVVIPRFFNAQVGVPSLEEVGVEWDVVMKMWHKNYRPEFFCGLKAIEIKCYPGECELFPAHFFQKLPKLEKIGVGDSSAEEILVQEKSGSELKKYHGSLELSNWANLKNMMILMMHFQNVTKLVISKCHGLVFLIPSSTAKTLFHLRKMKIMECEMLQEIVGSDEGDGAVEDVICFSQLKDLKLDSLACLTSFCSHNYAFSFPSLNYVRIKDCPEMKYFAPGVLATPKLEAVCGVGDYSRSWEGSLDNTIREFARNTN